MARQENHDVSRPKCLNLKLILELGGATGNN